MSIRIEGDIPLLEILATIAETNALRITASDTEIVFSRAGGQAIDPGAKFSSEL